MSYKGFSRKTEFALFLDIKSNVLSNWYNRNSFDENILANKFPEISYTWLLTSEGSMLKGSNVVNGENNISVHSSKNIKVNDIVWQHKEFTDIIKTSQEQLSESQKQQNKLLEQLSESQRQTSELIKILSEKMK